MHGRNRSYYKLDNIERIGLIEQDKVLYGDKRGEFIDVYSVPYLVEWGLDYQQEFISIDAHTGEVLYTISPTAWVEEWEDRKK